MCCNMGTILANITLNEISQTAKNKYHRIPLLVNIWNRKIHRDRSRIEVTSIWEEGRIITEFLFGMIQKL